MLNATHLANKAYSDSESEAQLFMSWIEYAMGIWLLRLYACPEYGYAWLEWN